MNLKKMSIGEKIARLSEIDKAYILGYIDRALSGTANADKLPKRGGREKPVIKEK